MCVCVYTHAPIDFKPQVHNNYVTIKEKQKEEHEKEEQEDKEECVQHDHGQAKFQKGLLDKPQFKMGRPKWLLLLLLLLLCSLCSILAFSSWFSFPSMAARTQSSQKADALTGVSFCALSFLKRLYSA